MRKHKGDNTIITIEYLTKEKYKTKDTPMKKSILTIAILISGIFISSTLVTGCGSKKDQTAEQGHDHMSSDSTNKHDDMAMSYACPMHPEVTGKDGDSCSKCSMKLEQVIKEDSTEVHEH